MFSKISLKSKDVLTIENKKAYIDKLYPERITYTEDKYRNQGFFHKFNNALGFKEVLSYITNNNTYVKEAVESPESYRSPYELLMDCVFVPVTDPNIIAEFYIPNLKIEHPDSRFSYNTKNVADKFSSFLNKIYPELTTGITLVDSEPKRSLFEFTLDFFFNSIEKNLNCSVEFSSSELLSQEEINKLIETLQPLSNDRLAVAQFKCDTCLGNSNGIHNIHIEVVYMTWYGKDVSKDRKNEYGEFLFTV